LDRLDVKRSYNPFNKQKGRDVWPLALDDIRFSLSRVCDPGDHLPCGIMPRDPLPEHVLLAIPGQHSDETAVLFVDVAEGVTGTELAVGYIQKLRASHQLAQHVPGLDMRGRGLRFLETFS
jgi:hypothetical protein